MFIYPTVCDMALLKAEMAFFARAKEGPVIAAWQIDLKYLKNLVCGYECNMKQLEKSRLFLYTLSVQMTVVFLEAFEICCDAWAKVIKKMEGLHLQILPWKLTVQSCSSAYFQFEVVLLPYNYHLILSNPWDKALMRIYALKWWGNVMLVANWPSLIQITGWT